ncbi:hypothetical protein DRO61_06530 [Candidatus Bathyarchaeota archaeon]|nr:MAG: hypothetical protein DRO61_06530 [Candidatus Bathyarchaeota archaeon]
MAEHDTIKTVKSQQGLLDKIQNFFLGGFATKEDLRELDKKMRDTQYQTLNDMRHTWEEIYLNVLDANVKVSKRDLKRVLQKFDLVMAKIRRADYGYAGLWNRKGQINENELARVFNFDKTITDDITVMETAVQKTNQVVEDENWIETRKNIKQIKKLIYELEDKWNERENLFRPLE